MSDWLQHLFKGGAQQPWKLDRQIKGVLKKTPHSGFSWMCAGLAESWVRAAWCKPEALTSASPHPHFEDANDEKGALHLAWRTSAFHCEHLQFNGWE